VSPGLAAKLRSHCTPWLLAFLLAPTLSFAPFAWGIATGGCFYTRDLSSHFFPIRRFEVEGLRAGEIREWNPYVYEGIPVTLPPVSYPVDLLQVLVPNEWGFSLLLALHVPLAALTFLLLARRLGYPPTAAAVGALAYSLGGFSLSCLNLYLMIEAFAWAPLVIATLLGAASGGRREVALAGVAVAVCLSTSGLEIAAQAIVCGLVLAATRRAADSLRPAAGVLLGVGLAAFPLEALFRLVSGGRREGGFPLVESLSQSVHPVSLLQTLVAGLYGDPIASGYRYWGARFWGGPSPYILSLYLGGTVLCLAAIGALRSERYRARLLLLLAGALLVSFGRWARLDLLLEALPVLTSFRYPVKAFFTVVVASSVLAAAGADALLKSRRAWWLLALGAGVVAAALVSIPLVETGLPRAFAWLQGHFFVDSYPKALRAPALREVARDAAAGATALFVTAGLSVLVLRRLIRVEMATAAICVIVAADLVRAGAGLNPMADRSLYTFSPEMTRVAARLREGGGRAFTCTIQAMPTFREAARRIGRPLLWATTVWRETLSPRANMDLGVANVGWDATAFLSTRRSLTEAEAMCRAASTLPRLRERGVRYILSVQPFTNEALRLVDVERPARTRPLSIYVYELTGSLPDPTAWSTPDDVDAQGRGRLLEGAAARYVDAGWDHVRVAVESPRAAYLIVRRANAPGWSATVDGAPAPVLTANGRHQAVPIPKGASEVSLRYRAPSSLPGVAVSLLSAVLAAALALGRRSGASAPPPPPPAGG
jgi:hypothetical protein